MTIQKKQSASHGKPAQEQHADGQAPRAMAHGPPEHISPGELVAMLEQVPRPSKKVDYPRKMPGTDTSIGEIAIVPATQQEQILAQAAAELYTQEVLRNKKDPSKSVDATTLGYANVYKNAATVELLYRTCRKPTSKLDDNAFPSPQWMRHNMLADEVGVLMNLYLRVQIECGPILAYLTNEECDLWIEKLAAGARTDPLGSLSSGALIDLILRLVFHLRNSRMATSSSGTPHDGSGRSTGDSSESDSANAGGLDEPPDIDVEELPEPSLD
ncbi:MAG TPA: hypothetical protein VGI39_39010 [Polyangiaceae bacterium]